MSLTCPRCASSGEFLRQNDDMEVRKCRTCGYEYEVRIDIDDDPYPDELDYPDGGPTCPHCHSTTTQLQGATSDGDGDLYNEYHCSTCGESFGINYHWYDEDEPREPTDYSRYFQGDEPDEDDVGPCSCSCGCTSLTYTYICSACEHGDHAD